MSRSLYARLARRHGAGHTLDRRRFLQATLAASASAWLTACRSSRARPGDGARPRVVIVGAGLAGLACALDLVESGCDVVVLEARARPGGRTRTLHDFAPGARIEAGGEFIGTNHPRWLALAQRFDLPLRESESEEELEAPIVLGGERLSMAQGEQLFHEMSAALALIDRAAAPVEADEPWRSANAHELDRTSVAATIASFRLSERCERALCVQFTADNGVPVERMSSLALLAMVKGGGLERFWTDSEVLRCVAGNDELAARMAHELGERVRVHSPVIAIEHGSSVRVTAADGRVHAADHIVLAVPPTVWSKIQVEPPLSNDLAPQMGRSIKYLARVKRRYWRDAGLAPDAFTDGDVSFTWESSDGQKSEQAVLCAFSSADSADRFRARAGAALHAAYVEALEPLFPGYARELVDTRFADWPSEPWTLGGYSFPAPGEVTARLPRIRAGLGRLHFAGEHTSSCFPGYMEGALESGARVARVIRADCGAFAPITASGR
ncbi:MAG: flavin monoamine oxidase family protein [Planctomycetota bacterium]